MAWVVTVVVVASLIYLIVRAVLSKTEPQSLPEVLRALGPMIKGIAQALARPLVQSLDPRESTPPGSHGQEGDTLYAQPSEIAAERNSPLKMVDGQIDDDPIMPVREAS